MKSPATISWHEGTIKSDWVYDDVKIIYLRQLSLFNNSESNLSFGEFQGTSDYWRLRKVVGI